MGFGTLFIGYFLLLNVTYYAYSDLVAALIMALGLYKLSSVNRYFKYAAFISLAFAAVGATEFVREIIRMFSPTVNLTFAFLPPIRSAVICALTVCMLFGIHDVAREVDLPTLAARTKRMLVPTAVIYLATIILDTPTLLSGVSPIVAALIFVIVMIATLFLIICNLITVYSAYMRICMPDELEPSSKKSRFEFVNKFRAYEDKKAAEYVEYKRTKVKNKAKKK